MPGFVDNMGEMFVHPIQFWQRVSGIQLIRRHLESCLQFTGFFRCPTIQPQNGRVQWVQVSIQQDSRMHLAGEGDHFNLL